MECIDGSKCFRPKSPGGSRSRWDQIQKMRLSVGSDSGASAKCTAFHGRFPKESAVGTPDTASVADVRADA